MTRLKMHTQISVKKKEKEKKPRFIPCYASFHYTRRMW